MAAGRPDRWTAGGLALKALVGLLWLAGAAAAMAQYKVVAPDGSVTYTDRPTVGAGGRAEPLRAAGADARAAVELPYALRQAVARYPVTLYTSPTCTPCDAGRALLRKRGVPVTERTVATHEDAAELRRLEQTTDLPILRLGAQRMVGFQPDDWSGMLDAAGYPRESQLPGNYRPPAPQPLVPLRPLPAANENKPFGGPTTVPPPTAPGEGGIRF